MHSRDDEESVRTYEIGTKYKKFFVRGTSICSTSQLDLSIYNGGDIVALFSNYEYIIDKGFGTYE
jgi:hypothetical protein